MDGFSSIIRSKKEKDDHKHLTCTFPASDSLAHSENVFCTVVGPI